MQVGQSLNDCRIVKLPKILDDRGNLSFVEQRKHVPFDIKRAYWIYDVPGGEVRGGHAYREQEEFIVALSGSFDVALDDGVNKKVVSLNRSYFGLFVPRMIWRHLENFSTNAVAVILASHPYTEGDYLRAYDEFKHLKHA